MADKISGNRLHLLNRIIGRCILLFAFSVSMPILADDSSSGSGQGVMGEFSFEFMPDGTPKFTQVLRWEGDPNVLFYELILQKETGEDVSSFRIEEPRLELNLVPGGYRYKLVLFNFLGKPEIDLPWQRFTVLKAETPRVTTVFPKAWYLEDLKSRLTIAGKDLDPDATIVLKHSDGDETPLVGTVTKQNGTTKMRVEFPEECVTTGHYTLELTNPGGLSRIVPLVLPVRTERPLDIIVSAGYAPWISLYDSWYTEIWPGTLFPLSFVSRVSVYFIKTRFGYVGGEFSTGGRLMTGGTDDAEIGTEIGLTGISAIYKYCFSRRLFANARLGFGLTYNHHEFNYEGTKGGEISSIDPYVSAGLSSQFGFTKKIFLEVGVDWMHIFPLGFSGGGLMPFISAGFLF